MFPRVQNRLLIYPATVFKNVRQCCNVIGPIPSGKTEVVYPPLNDVSLKGRKKLDETQREETFRKIHTVEEKLFKLNMPRYYGWKCALLNESTVPYNSLPVLQYITRTHLAPERQLPALYDTLRQSMPVQSNVKAVARQIEDALVFEHEKHKRYKLREGVLLNLEEEENRLANGIIYQINRILQANLSREIPHLLESIVDFQPRIEAFWVAGQVHYYQRKSGFDQPIQYKGSPMVQMRHQFPLQEVVSLSESENPEFEAPIMKYDLRVMGYRTGLRHVTSIPGFWPGDTCEFGLLSYHNRGYMHRKRDSYNDLYETIAGQAIVASYGWLLAQACYQGFSTYNDITYPLVTQSVVTDGQWWSFGVYQLNTLLVHGQHIDTNPKRNICWMTEPLALYEKIEDGKVHGLNESVLETIMSFYANVPRQRENVNMTPYLGDSVRVIADIEDDERRVWLEKHFKHLTANRPRHRIMPEVYNWERIYVMARPSSAYRVFGKNTLEERWNACRRRLDDHKPRYIPKRLRLYPKRKKRGRWEKTYYP